MTIYSVNRVYDSFGGSDYVTLKLCSDLRKAKEVLTQTHERDILTCEKVPPEPLEGIHNEDIDSWSIPVNTLFIREENVEE